jgi:hypothetical protein
MHRSPLLCLLLILAFGCDGKAPAPPVAAAPPAPTAPTPTPTPQPTAAPASQPALPAPSTSKLPTGHPEVPRPSATAAGPASQPMAAAASNQPAPGSIRGMVVLSPGLESSVKPGSVLYVMVRRFAGPGGAKGVLLAAKKLSVAGPGAFPMPYEVTQRDVKAGSPLAGVVQVSARIDGDGDAITKLPGDLEGASPSPVPVGTSGVRIVMSRKL